MKILKAQSFRTGIILSTIFNFLSKGLLFGQGLFIAYFFGANDGTDIYFFFNSTILLVSAMVNSLDNSVLIPESMILREKFNNKIAMDFLNSFIVYYVIFISFVLFIFFIFQSVILSAFTEFPIQVLAPNRNIIFLSLPLFLLTVITVFLINILTSYRYFTVAMISSSIQSVLVISFMFFFSKSLDINSILIAQNISYIINLIILVLVMRRSLGWNFDIKIVPVKKNTWRNIAFAQCGNLATFFSSFFQYFTLSGLPMGTITTYNYSQRVSEVPNSLLTTQMSSIAGVKYNELAAANDYEELNKVYLVTTKFLLFVLTPISFIVSYFSEEIIAILYQRGAFQVESISHAASFLRFLILLLPLTVIITNSSRIYMATQIVKFTFYYQIFANLALILLIFIGVKFYGALGLPVSILAMNFVNIFIIHFFMKAFLKYIDYSSVLMYLAKVVLVSAIGFSVSILVVEALEMTNILYLVAVSLLTGALVMLISFVFQINREANQIILNFFKYVFRQKRNA
jgi:putative peptidoglycan lipid II flippase